MWLKLLVFVSDAAITWLAAREQLALTSLSWSAVWWDAGLTLAISLNMIGFAVATWGMIPWSVGGSMLGMAIAIWFGRRSAK